MLRVRDLTIRFPLPGGGLIPVRDFSLNLEPGEILGLVGPSGCGKTVFCSALMGMLEAPGYIAGGSIRYVPPHAGPGEALDLTALSENAWRSLRGKEISLIMQNPVQALNPSRTVGAQLIEAIRVHCPRLSRREAGELARAALADASLGEPRRIMGSYPFELSGGMCQRALIAMALVHKPAILIADEPTTALDKKNEAQIISLFERLRDAYHTGILLVSHDAALIRSVTDRRVSM